MIDDGAHPPPMAMPVSPSVGGERGRGAVAAVRHPGVAWLVRLRWISAVGQLAGLGFVARSTTSWVQMTLLGIALATALSNLGLRHWFRRVAPELPQTMWSVMGWTLTLDCLLLTAWLALTGATSNPFTLLYLVHIVLAAVVLNARWTAWLSSLSILSFAGLFLVPSHACCAANLEQGVETAYLTHMQGMWFAFATAAVLISYLVRQLTLSAEYSRDQIAALHTQAQQAAHMASLTTLAAGAAHELRTPLGTIAVAAHELKRSAARLGHDAVTEDAKLIEAEVQRCQAILTGMGLRWRAQTEPPAVVAAVDIVAELAQEYADVAPRVHFHRADPALSIRAVHADVVVALRGMLNNALDATEARGRVTFSVRQDASLVQFVVEDDGCGMPPSVVERAAEPFFTTKTQGRGVGLGLFVAFACAENNRGSLHVSSQPEAGTRVVLAFPKEPA